MENFVKVACEVATVGVWEVVIAMKVTAEGSLGPIEVILNRWTLGGGGAIPRTIKREIRFDTP